MIYLFNNNYLMLDVALESGVQHLIASPIASKLPTDEFSVAVTREDLGVTLATGTSYEEMATNAGGDDQILRLLTDAGDVRTHIYADPESLVVILIKWYKALLVNIDAAAAYRLIHLQLMRLSNTLGYSYTPRVRLSEAQAAQYKTLWTSFPFPLSKFRSVWKSTKAFDMSARGHEYYAARCGVEFQIATYWADENWGGKVNLEQKLVTLARSTYIKQVRELFDMVAVRCTAIPGYSFEQQTLAEWAASQTEYVMVVDPAFKSSNLDYVYTAYTAGEIKSTVDACIRFIGGEPRATSVGQLMFADADLTIDAILQVELDCELFSPLIAASTRQQVVDTYVLRRLYNERKAKDNTLARKLSLQMK